MMVRFIARMADVQWQVSATSHYIPSSTSHGQSCTNPSTSTFGELTAHVWTVRSLNGKEIISDTGQE